ncbi:unnamed protein product [Dovyalis caffra]|uniref:Uncharacterized protein n=1 Tax=Dovyalis caffra TaxID=77055 RepID=A0AAV1RG33_9ROSI|nr:unnamed protein product [Dovyalis caffra]
MSDRDRESIILLRLSIPIIQHAAAMTLRTYPAELTLTVLVCLVAALEGTIFAVFKE